MMTSPSSQTSTLPAESPSPSVHLEEPSGARARTARQRNGRAGFAAQAFARRAGRGQAGRGRRTGQRAQAAASVCLGRGQRRRLHRGLHRRRELQEQARRAPPVYDRRAVSAAVGLGLERPLRRHAAPPHVDRLSAAQADRGSSGRNLGGERRWGYLSLSTVASLASMSRICGATVPELLERLVESPTETGTAFAKSSLQRRGARSASPLSLQERVRVGCSKRRYYGVWA